MPLATAYLVALTTQITINQYVKTLHASVKPLVTARVIRWIIRPERLSTSPLLTTQWDLLVILPSSTAFPEDLLSSKWTTASWSISAGVPSRIVNDFATHNQELLHPRPESVPPLTGSLDKPLIAGTSQTLELSQELQKWSQTFTLGQNTAVSMLNLLAFNSSPEAHASYKVYGQAFASSIGARRGGEAKIVGKVVPGQKTKDEDGAGWDEIALAHYPSIRHFVDMLASEDYQKVNHESRLPALRDTCILCTSELHPDVLVENEKSRL